MQFLEQGPFGLLVIVLAQFAQSAGRGDHYQVIEFLAEHLPVEPGCGGGGVGILVHHIPGVVARAGMVAAARMIVCIEFWRWEHGQFRFAFIAGVAIEFQILAIDDCDYGTMGQQHLTLLGIWAGTI